MRSKNKEATPAITRIVLYVRNMPEVAAFYRRHFHFESSEGDNEEKITLRSPSGGCSLVLLQASKGHRTGQSCIKIVFDVADVAAFKKEKEREGLKFSVIHKGPGYEFSNARDPAKNLVQISNCPLPG